MYHSDLIRHPDSCPALVLNADYTPLSYYPLSLWPWQTAVKAMFLERVDVVLSAYHAQRRFGVHRRQQIGHQLLPQRRDQQRAALQAAE